MGVPPTRLLAAAAVIVGAYLVWTWAFVSDEDRVRTAIHDTAAALSTTAADPLGQVAGLGRLRERLGDDIVVTAGDGAAAIRGRDALVGLWQRRRAGTSTVSVKVRDLAVQMGPESTTADADFVAEATVVASGGDESFDAREVRASLVKRNGAWLLSQVTVVDAVTPVR